MTGQHFKRFQGHNPAQGQGQGKLLGGNDGNKEDLGRGRGRRRHVSQEEETECAKAEKGNKALCIQGNEII